MPILFFLMIFFSFPTSASTKEDEDYEKYIHNIYLQNYKNPISHSDWNNKIRSLPRQYQLKHKDNLWDLSGSFLKDSLYWSKIWVANPQVENPHSIYKGDSIKFDRQTLTAVNTSKHSVDIQAQFPGLVIPTNQFTKPALTEAEIPSSLPKMLNFQDVDHSINFDQLENVNVNTEILIPFYITDQAPGKKGEVVSRLNYGSFIGLSGEEVILKINGTVSIGSVVTVFRNKGEFGGFFQDFGANTQEIMIKGQIKIVSFLPSAEEPLYIGSIIEALDVISPGDSIFTDKAPSYNFSQKGPKGKVQGRIVGTPSANKSLLTLGSLAYLDKGFNDGVRVGEIFFIQGANRSLKRPKGYSLSSLGKLQIIHTGPNSSTGIIFSARDRIVLGDRYSGTIHPLKSLEESPDHEQVDELDTFQKGQNLFIDIEETPQGEMGEEGYEEVPAEEAQPSDSQDEGDYEEAPEEGDEAEGDLEGYEEVPEEEEGEVVEADSDDLEGDADSDDLEGDADSEGEVDEYSDDFQLELSAEDDLEEALEEEEEFEEELEEESDDEELEDFEDLDNL